MRNLEVIGGALLCAVMGLFPAAVEAQPADQGAARQAAAGGASSLGQGPSLNETGRIGVMPAATSDLPVTSVPAPRGASQLPASAERLSPDETGVAADTRYPGSVDAAILEREITSRFAPLRGCRAEVATRQRVPVSTIRASQLTLRWTILPTGAVEQTEVVATAATDPAVLNCVKRHMSTWAFTPATGGPARVERPFVLP